MSIATFIKLFGRKAVEEARVSFTVHAGLNRGGKWVFWCEKGKTLEDLVAFVESNKCLNDLEIDGFQQVELNPEAEDSLRVVISFE